MCQGGGVRPAKRYTNNSCSGIFDWRHVPFLANMYLQWPLRALQHHCATNPLVLMMRVQASV